MSKVKTLKSYRFDEKTLATIDELKEELELENNSAVLRRALTLLKVLADARQEGSKVIAESLNGERTLIVL